MEVTIDRIDVRVVTAAPVEDRSQPPRPRLTLDEYLGRRDAGR